MIFRPVRPVSPIGPPITNLPVGLHVDEVLVLEQPLLVVEVRRAGSGAGRARSRSGLISVSASRPSRCCVEIEHALDLDRPLVGRARRPRSGSVTCAFPSGPQVRQHVGLAHLREPLGRCLCASMIGSGISSSRLVGRVAEHHPLVAGADPVERIVVARVVLRLVRGVDALRDVGRLLVERDDHAAGLGVEAVLGARVADLARPSRARAAGCRRRSRS